MVPVPHPLLQAILAPLPASLVASLAGRKLGPKTGWPVGAILLYQTGLLALITYYSQMGQARLEEHYSWAVVPAVGLDLVGDGLSLPLALTISLICSCLAFYSIRYVEYRVEELYGEGGRAYYALYYALYPLFPAGLIGMALANNLIMIWFFMEVLLIPAYFIIAYFGYSERRKVAVMCFLWGTVASTLFMAGAFMAYSQVGSFSLSALPALSGRPSARLACSLMALGLLVKMAVLGFHVWVPWVEGEPPTHVGAILACYTNMGAYIMVRVLVLPLPGAFGALSPILMAWALITMVFGALLALAQDDVKRLCACSTISQVAYSLLGVADMAPSAVAGGLFYMVSHLLGKAILFSTAGLLVYGVRERDMSHMGGLGKYMPSAAVLWALGSMILSAIPPFSGLPAELVMFSAIFSSSRGSGPMLAVAICAVLATALTVAYTFWPLKRVFMGEPRAPSGGGLRGIPPSMALPLLPLVLASAILGLRPDLIMGPLMSVLGGRP